MLYFIIVFIIIVIFWIYLIIKFQTKTWLSNEQKIFFEKKYKKISNWIDKKHQVIDFDKLYHKLLLDLWYKGSFGEILKQNPKEIDNINKIWELHKLRNKLVHDFDLLANTILIKKSKEYREEFNKILKKVS